MAIKNKKGFAFSFFALFIMFLIFLFGTIYLGNEDFTKETVFIDARIGNINNEVVYFKDSYLPNAASFALYNSLGSLLTYLDGVDSFDQVSQNHERLNELIFEGMVNGSFEGVVQPGLSGKTMTHFITEYQNEFSVSQRGTFTYEPLAINVFEENPYFVSVHVVGRYNVSMNDNLSSWIFVDEFSVNVPIFDLPDPEFLISADLNIPIRSVEFYIGLGNWTPETLNLTLQNNYATVYLEPKLQYTIGNSFLNRFMNFTQSSYGSVMGYWQFDYDEDTEGVNDSSQLNDAGDHFGNTALYMSFDLNKVSGGTVTDQTDYENDGTINGGIVCNSVGIHNLSCDFDGDDDYISIPNTDLDLSSTKEVTVSAWIYPRDFQDGFSLTDSEIFRYGSGFNDIINMRTTAAGNLRSEIGSHNGGTYINHIGVGSLVLDAWNHVAVSFDGDSGESRLYINGILDSSSTSDPITSFLQSGIDIGIGDVTSSTDRGFNGRIDELNVFSKALSDVEVAAIYSTSKGRLVDYVDSVFGKGVYFDGVDDYATIPQDSFLLSSAEFSAEAWVKLEGINLDTSITTVPYASGSNNLVRLGVDTATGNFQFYTEHLSGADEWDIPFTIEYDRYYYLLGTFDGTNKRFYVNGELVGGPRNVASNFRTSSDDLIIGADDNGGTIVDFFNGTIDEVKFHNRTLEANDARLNYFNYNSNGKGCCNYMIMVNSNTMGFNNVAYDEDIPYSSTQFFNFHVRDQPNNDLTFSELSSFTSNNPANIYYNLNFDMCMAQIYDLFSYNDTRYVPSVNLGVQGTTDCDSLIKKGFY